MVVLGWWLVLGFSGVRSCGLKWFWWFDFVGLFWVYCGDFGAWFEFAVFVDLVACNVTLAILGFCLCGFVVV